jgi:AraC-like DNA-binding protein
MIFQFIKPPKILENYVRHFWVLRFNEGNDEKLLKLYSDYNPMLVFQCLDEHCHITSKDGSFLSNSFLSGIKSKPIDFIIRGTYAHIAVNLYPHALRHILRIDPFELTNQFPDLINFCPKDLSERIYFAKNTSQRIAILTDFLVTRIQEKYGDDPIVQDCIFSKYAMNEWALGSQLKKHKISKRHLERKFKTSIGIPPKTYLRITRFEKALNLLQAGTFDKLSSIAFDLGYSDHSHFTKDFKISSGFTPTTYLASKRVIEYGGSFVDG